MLRLSLYERAAFGDNGSVTEDSGRHPAQPFRKKIGVPSALTQAAAPAARAAREFVASVWTAMATPLACPRCGDTIALLASQDRCLYRAGDEPGTFGAALSTSPSERVGIYCPRCRKTRQISGRGVSRRLHRGLEPFA